jgi:putative salt-induced outer membrane protein YdiY
MAEEEKELGWSDKADFSLVGTSGNSESFTIGAKNLLTRDWKKAKLELTVGLIRSETNDIDRHAVENRAGNDFHVVEEDNRDTDPERYYFNSLYARLISEKLYWYTGLDWERNRPAAVESRTVVSAGVGNLWFKTDKIKWNTDYGATYTDEEDTNGETFTYGGLRLRSTYEHKFNDSTTYKNTLILDENLDDRSDFRADILNELQVSMNKRLALKLALRVQFDNRPAFEEVDLREFPGGPKVGDVDAEKEETDTTFTGSLVISF